jgi:hypothetical protein
VLFRILVFAAGLFVTLWTVASAVRTVILPRSAQSLLSRGVFRSIRVGFRVLAGPSRSYDWRDRVMAYFGPVGLITLVVVWLGLVTVSFTLMTWAVEQDGWARAYHLSGSSLLTLGFAGADGLWLRTMAFAEAALGLALLALLITYLPTLYGAFSRREALVALLEVRAGTPPSAVEMLQRFHRIGWTHRLSDLWTDWERWFAEVEESHTSYPVLTFFRSPQPDRHWVTAAGTVLDGAALSMAALHLDRQPQAALALRAGYISLRRIADSFGIEYEPDPAPDDPISITRREFDDALDRLDAEGVAITADRDRAWRDFAGWRVNYDTVLLDLAELTMAPYAPWSSDRSTPRHRRPKVRRWGRRRRFAGLGS